MEGTQTTTSSSAGTTKRVVTIRPPKLFALQEEIVASTARFRVIVNGRRWGKTRLGAWLALRDGCNGKRVWWVAPVIATAKILWRLLEPLIRKIPGTKIRKSEKVFLFPGGGELWIKSADQPDNLRGEGLDGLFLDEADYIEAGIWTKTLRPMLADRKGWALFISTPREENGWFHQLYKKGLADGKVWASWNYPSETNPYLDPDEIDQARAEMSDLEFLQEFMALFVGQPDAVYHNFSTALHVKPTRFDPLLPVYVGLDFNNTPRVACFIQIDPQTKIFRGVGEIYYPNQATTDEHARMVADWLTTRGVKQELRGNKKVFPSSKVICIADASGKSKNHAGKSDHEDFRSAGFTLDVPAANPAIKDRDNAVLAALKNAKGEVRTQIDPSCKHLIECFQKFKHKNRSTSPWGHALDAWGYVIYRKTRVAGRTEREMDNL